MSLIEQWLETSLVFNSVTCNNYIPDLTVLIQIQRYLSNLKHFWKTPNLQCKNL